MLQVHHFSFEFIFQNIHKSKLISQRLSQNADDTCHTNLSNTQYSDLIVWNCSLFFQDWCNQFSLRVAIVARGEKVLQRVVRAARRQNQQPASPLAQDPQARNVFLYSTLYPFSHFCNLNFHCTSIYGLYE